MKVPVEQLAPPLAQGGDKLRVAVCSANLGNAAVTDLSPWIPPGGGGCDLVVVGLQESTYEVSDAEYVGSVCTLRFHRGQPPATIHRRPPRSSALAIAHFASVARADTRTLAGSTHPHRVPPPHLQPPRYERVMAESKQRGTLVCPEPGSDDEGDEPADGSMDAGSVGNAALAPKMSFADLQALRAAESGDEGDEGEEGDNAAAADASAPASKPAPTLGKAENTSKSAQFASVLGGGRGEAHLLHTIENHLGKCNYILVANVTRLMMRIRVYARKELETRIHSVECGAENTGFLGGTIANKGGQAIKLVVDNTSLCFVSSHLAPHEGRKNCDTRNANVKSILEGSLSWMGKKDMDLGSQYHHCFWMGDMNYRSEVPVDAAWGVNEKSEVKAKKHEHGECGEGQTAAGPFSSPTRAHTPPHTRTPRSPRAGQGTGLGDAPQL